LSQRLKYIRFYLALQECITVLTDQYYLLTSCWLTEHVFEKRSSVICLHLQLDIADCIYS